MRPNHLDTAYVWECERLLDSWHAKLSAVGGGCLLGDGVVGTDQTCSVIKEVCWKRKELCARRLPWGRGALGASDGQGPPEG